jgi:hypothetical protein
LNIRTIRSNRAGGEIRAGLFIAKVLAREQTCGR